MESELPLWVKYAQALAVPALTIVIGAVGVYVAHKQMTIARWKLTHELLYKPRWAIYEAAREFLAKICREGRAENSDIAEYTWRITDADMIFEPSVGAYLNEIRTRAVKFHALNLGYKNLPEGPERTAAVDAESEAFTWFGKQFDVLKEKLFEDLKLDPSLNWKRVKQVARRGRE